MSEKKKPERQQPRDEKVNKYITKIDYVVPTEPWPEKKKKGPR